MMRLIDVDELNERFERDCTGECGCCRFSNDFCDLIDMSDTVNAISIPLNATNGDMLMAIFQGVKIWKHEGYVCVAFNDFYEIKKFPEYWWNAPYKREGE